MKNKQTKRALLGSVMTLLLCFTMLLGTTFAWFTDTSSTSVNTIQAGTLSVDIVDANGSTLEGQKLSFKDVQGSTTILWEPGATFTTETFKIANKGNLALKFNFALTGITGDEKILDVITFELVDKDGTAVDLNSFTGHLTKNTTSSEYAIKATMATSAGNQYQGKKLEGVALVVYATQDTVEYDITGNQYDKDASYFTETSSVEGALYGKIYKNVSETLSSTGIRHTFKNSSGDGMAIYLYKGAELTLNDVDMSTSVANDTGKRNIGFYLYNGSKLTINSGNYTMDGQYSALIWAQGGKNGERCTVTINGGNFVVKGGANSTIVNAYSNSDYCGSDISITGGFFDLSAANPNVTLQWKNDSTMTVTGGTFVNYNPADHGVVPSGYKVVTSVQENGKTWYTVVHE